jgi:N-acetylglucosamine repressor
MLHKPFFPLIAGTTQENLQGVDKKRFLQKIKILRNLYVYGPTSNAEISRKLHTSLPTSINLMEELLQSGVVEKKGHGSSIGGRKPVLFGLRNSSFYSLGIEVSRFKTQMAIYDSNNQISSDTLSFRGDFTQKTEFVEELYLKATHLAETSSIDLSNLICVGLMMPGLINSQEGRNYTHLDFGSKTITEVLEEKFKRPVFIENDAKAMAYSELRFGKAREKKNVLVIFMEWGLGLGIIMNGRIYRGSLGFAGELSHIPAVDNKIYCQCGKQGCLETIASGSAISRMAREGIISGKMSSLKDNFGNGSGHIEISSVVRAANQGDLFAIGILSEVGMNLGKGLASLMQLFNPEMVILSGMVCEAEQYIITPIKQALNVHCMPQLRENTEVVISELGSDYGRIGAVSMAMEYVFAQPFGIKLANSGKADEENIKGYSETSVKK